MNQYTKQIDASYINIKDHRFIFENTFNKNVNTPEIYKFTFSPLINTVNHKGIITLFTFGRTCQELVKNKT